MADRYFDNNGTTAGFGTLTGNWDNGVTARWSTSSAGTATVAVYTFTNEDTAIFGAPPATATGGSVSIPTGNTITLNKLQYNLSTQQVIGAAGSGNLTFSGTNPSIVNLGTGQPIISAPINFPNGLAIQPGQGALVLQNIGQSNNSGTVSITDGTLYLQSSGTAGLTPDQIKGATAIALSQSVRFTSAQYYGSVAYTEPASVSASYASADPVTCGIYSHNNAGVTLTHGSVASFTGGLGALAYSTSTLTGRLILNTAPASCGALLLQSNGLTTSQAGVAPIIVFNHSGTATITGIVYLASTQASTAAATVNYVLEQNSAGLTTFSGNVLTYSNSNASAFHWLRLTGTGTSALTGNYAPTLGTSGLRKLGSGQWELSGNNTYNGSTLIEAGTLVASSDTALGAASSAGSTSISGTGVLVISAGSSVNKSLTDFSVTNTNNPIRASGAGVSTFRTKGLSLASSATTTFDVDANATLVLSPENAGVITGSSAAITKTGSGTLRLVAAANSFSGNVTVSQGVLEVGSVSNTLGNSAWGAGSLVQVVGTLRYTGTGHSSSRPVQMASSGGSSPTLDASGSGALTLSGITQDANAKTMTLRGSSTESIANTISSAIANNGGAVSIAKEDSNRWVLSGALSYTGTTSINGGTLRVQASNSNATSGAVTIGASGTAELVTDTLASSTAGAGRVFGNSDIAVSGAIKTRGGTTQRGQVRYGGNLTFGNGSTLYVGVAT